MKMKLIIVVVCYIYREIKLQSDKYVIQLAVTHLSQLFYFWNIIDVSFVVQIKIKTFCQTQKYPKVIIANKIIKIHHNNKTYCSHHNNKTLANYICLVIYSLHPKKRSLIVQRIWTTLRSNSLYKEIVFFFLRREYVASQEQLGKLVFVYEYINHELKLTAASNNQPHIQIHVLQGNN